MTIYPAWQSNTVTDFNSDATSHAANMPATVNPADLLLAFAAFDAATTTITTPAGWTKLIGESTATSMVDGVYAKVAVGNEDSTTVDFVTSNSQRGSVAVVRVNSWAGILDGLVAMLGSGAGPGSLSFGSTSRDFLAVAASCKSSATTFGTVPSGYTNESKTGVGEDSGSSASVVVASRTVTASAEEVATWWNTSALFPVYIVAVLPVGALIRPRPTTQIGG